MNEQQQRQTQIATELGPETTKRLTDYMKKYAEKAATLSWCPRCQTETETKTVPISTYISERTCRACGYLKR